MANYQNSMRCMRRPVQSIPAPACECRRAADGCPETRDRFPAGMPVAMAYVPWQQWQTTYSPERGLVQGTIFPDLDLKFAFGGCSK